MLIIHKEQRLKAKSLVSQGGDLLDRIVCVSSSRKVLEDDLNHAVEKQLDDAVHARLSSLSVEELNRQKQGIRINSLKNAGVTTVQQVLDRGEWRIGQIRGIGEDSVSKIFSNAHKLEREARQSVRLRLDPDSRTAPTTRIVKDLYLLLNGNELFDRCERFRSEHAADLNNRVVEAKRIAGFFGGVFSRTKTKQIGLEATDWLEANNNAIAEALDLLEGDISVLTSARSDDVWADFIARAAEYYTLLGTLAGVTKRDATKGSLPEALVQKVLKFPLDLSLMRTRLRPYQRFGAQYALCQRCTLLGDEMGLGKTVEAIAATASLAGDGDKYFVVVCPLGVLVNWEREIPKHSLLTTTTIYGADRDDGFSSWCKTGGVALMTYETVSRLEWDDAPDPAMLVVDEAHYVKNPQAARTQAVIALSAKAERVLYMSGTPLENKVEEMNFLISCLQPSVARKASNLSSGATAIEYRKEIAPVYLRRTREDVLSELPEKVEMQDWCTFSSSDFDDYQKSLRDKSFSGARRVAWSHGNLNDSAKASRLMEIMDDAREEGRLVLIFSFFLDTLSQVEKLLGDRCAGVINGGVTGPKRQAIIDEFAKAEPGAALVCQVTAGGVGLNIQAASVVVFCEPQLKPSTENQAISRSYRMADSR